MKQESWIPLPPILAQKLQMIAAHDGRTPEKEIEYMVQESIREYEEQYGEIKVK